MNNLEFQDIMFLKPNKLLSAEQRYSLKAQSFVGY